MWKGFYYHNFDSMSKTFLHKELPTKKNYARPKKNSYLGKLTPTHPPEKKIMVRWLLMQVITQASQSQNKLCMRQFVCRELYGKITDRY